MDNSRVRKLLGGAKLKGLRVRMLGEYDDRVIDGIYHAACDAELKINSNISKKLEEIKGSTNVNGQELSEVEAFLGDDAFEAELIRRAAEEMVVIALYKTVEIAIKRMLRFSGLFADHEIRSFHRVSEMKRLVRDRVADLEGMPGFDCYDELRCINNCVKHSGVVGDELGKFPGWVEGEKLDRLWDNYQRLKPGVRKFVRYLSERLVEKM